MCIFNFFLSFTQSFVFIYYLLMDINNGEKRRKKRTGKERKST